MRKVDIGKTFIKYLRRNRILLVLEINFALKVYSLYQLRGRRILVRVHQDLVYCTLEQADTEIKRKRILEFIVHSDLDLIALY